MCTTPDMHIIAGFGTKIGQKSGLNRYLYCTRQGKYISLVSEVDRVREKTTKRCECNGKLRLKEDKYDKTCKIVDMNLEHNHHLVQSPSMLVFLHSHKDFNPTRKEFVKDLQFQNVPHHTIMSILYANLGGGQYLRVHGRDIINQTAKNSKEDDADDVQKLLSFFGEMKAINKEFFFDFELDDEDQIKNIF